jgi:atlastin
VNNAKNLFRSARTPAVLFVLLIIVYVCQEILQFLYLDAVAKLFGIALGIIFLTLALWAYTR